MAVSQIQPGLVQTFLRNRNGRELEKHLQAKYINHFWIGEASKIGKAAEAASLFPYQPKSRCIAEILDERLTPRANFPTIPLGTRAKPIFLTNIPIAHLPMEAGEQKIEELLSKLRDESFGETAKSSRPQASRKLGVVLGINQLHSIDPGVNRAFRKYIKKLTSTVAISYRITGFFWKPQWEENDKWKKVRGVKEALAAKPSLEQKLYPYEKAFLLFKCLNPLRGERIRRKLEGDASTGLSETLKTQIPFQGIRQAIKASAPTLMFAKKIAEMRGNAPVFYVTMDGDCRKLRTAGVGYFSRYEEIIAKTKSSKGFTPSVISLGYALDASALPIPRLAVKCDMAVRSAMNGEIGGSVYFPEPGTGYNLSENGELVKNLKAFSFLARAGLAKNALESRRAIDNGVRKKILDKDRFVFDPKGALVTSMPGRMRTKTGEKYETFVPASDLKKKEVLKALRGVSQVHFSPLDWAHHLYEGLPSEIKKGSGTYGKISGILTRAFAVFDPIGLIFTYEETAAGSFRSTFDKMFDLYETYAQTVLSGERENNVKRVRGVTRLILDDDENLREISDFVQGRFSLLLTTKKELIEAGFSDAWITKIISAASASGKALFKTLKKEIDAD